MRQAKVQKNYKNQAGEKSTKINFLGLETTRWGGGLPREGVVAEEFVLSLESLSSLGFEEKNLGCPGNFARCSKSLCKKVRAHFSLPPPPPKKTKTPDYEKYTKIGGFRIFFNIFFVSWSGERIRGVFWGSEGFCVL